MVLDRRSLERRLAELDEILTELRSQEGDALDADEIEDDLSRRWRLERGLLAGANLVLDVANHVMASHFGVHPATYEEAVKGLATRGVVDEATYEILRGIGGFRNVLAHEYLDVDLEEVVRWRDRMLDGGGAFIAEVERWLDSLDRSEEAT